MTHVINLGFAGVCCSDRLFNPSDYNYFLKKVVSLAILRSRVRVGRRGVIVIPKDIREKLGIVEGMFLELSVEGDRIVLKTRDLWSELRMRGRRLKVDIDEAERELDEDEEHWMERLKP